MTLKQISVEIEHSMSRLYEVTEALSAGGINLRGLNLSSSGEKRILRLLVSDLSLARRILMEHQLPAKIEDVVALRIQDTPGSLAQILRPLMQSGINIRYLYAYHGAELGSAVVVTSFSNNEEAITILKRENVKIITADRFQALEQELAP